MTEYYEAMKRKAEAKTEFDLIVQETLSLMGGNAATPVDNQTTTSDIFSTLDL